MGNNQPFSLVLLLLHLLLLSLYSDAQQYLIDTSEVIALNNISRTLKVSPPRIYDIYSCRRSDPFDGIGCRCDFYVTIKSSTRKLCRIRRLSFPNGGLKGTISPELGSLPYLEYIDLSGNDLTGSIPTTLNNLKYLESLYLSSNQLNGMIPDRFDKMMALRLLDLSYNFLDGPIPPSLGVLSNLKYLYLSSNLLTGTIPWQLGHVSSLLYMSLANNQLNGTLSPKLGELRNLTYMQISTNNFVGKLPKTFEKLTKLDFLSVRGNDLNGRVPDFIGTKWKYLRYLHLMGNKFEGTLPAMIFNRSRLIQLWVTDLRVDNDVFPSMSNLTSLESLILRNCSIRGEIPDYITNGSLTELDLSYNNFSGMVPTGLKTLHFLCLTRNNFTGSIPKWAPNSSLVDFSYNNFANDRLLQHNGSNYLNTFTPSILPTDINGECPREKHTSLHINCGGKSTIINRSNYEEDTSKLPFYVSPNKKWAYSSSGDYLSSSLDPRNNTKNISCGITVPLFGSARISPLTLDYYGLCLRNGAYDVTLHFAEIVYWDLDDHSILGKRLFDIYIQDELKVKDFNIKNEAPEAGEGVSKTWKANVTDNRLNIHLYWAGKGTVNVNAQYGPLLSAISVTPGYKTGKKLSPGSVAAITTSSVAFPLLLLALLWNLGYLGHNKLENDELEGEELQKRKVTFKNILEATQNFSPKMEIGRGGSGIVYKAVLKDGPPLAVKKLIAHSIKELREYINEVSKLQLLKNENLVQLLGWYTRSDQPLVIFEYMEMNSLYKAMFGDSKSRLVLSWKIRYNICLQIARGLVYLHEVAEKKIIHRDINPSNILLDAKLNAKISDFGLAKFYEGGQGTAVTKLCGTHGYMAPEYALRGVLSEKTDVYSYGILILEITTGKSNGTYVSSKETDFLFDEACFRWKNGSGDVLPLVDASITSEKEYVAQEASRVLSLAMLCTNQVPSLRPTMSEVVSVLDGKTSATDLLKAKIANPINDDPKRCVACRCVPAESTTSSFDGRGGTSKGPVGAHAPTE